jgi:hypothetical protein
VEDLLRQDEAVRSIEAEPVPPLGITAESEDKERRLNEADDLWFELAERITEVQAHSVAGLRAKASVMHLLLRRCESMPDNAPDADPGDRMAWSLAADVLAGRFVPLIDELTDQWAAQRRRMAGGAL